MARFLFALAALCALAPAAAFMPIRSPVHGKWRDGVAVATPQRTCGRVHDYHQSKHGGVARLTAAAMPVCSRVSTSRRQVVSMGVVEAINAYVDIWSPTVKR